VARGRIEFAISPDWERGSGSATVLNLVKSVRRGQRRRRGTPHDAHLSLSMSTDPGKGVPGGLQLKLTEPVLSLVQAVAMAEFAWTRISVLRSKTT
jgi:hypothetical protein